MAILVVFVLSTGNEEGRPAAVQYQASALAESLLPHLPNSEAEFWLKEEV